MSAEVASNRVDFDSRAKDLQLALLLTYITLGWMTIEALAALLLGWASKSLLLEAFGIDSVMELLSGSVLLWRLRVEARGAASADMLKLWNCVRRDGLATYSIYLSCTSFSIRVMGCSLQNALPIRMRACGVS